MNKQKLINLFYKVQRIPYQVCKYEELKVNEHIGKGDCRHKSTLLKALLEKEGFQTRRIKVIFDWKDLPIKSEILTILKSGTVWDHDSLEVKIDDKWIKVDSTWNPELKEIGFPITETWNGMSNTKQVTEGRLEFFSADCYIRDKSKIKIKKEEAYKFAETLNKFLKFGK